jgi:hypothetical protein
MILCGVRRYKAQCVTHYDQITAQATTYDELMTGFLASLGDTMREEAHLHRLWYDIRAQTLFEAAFRADVAEIDKSLENMIWRVVSRFAELTGEPQKVRPSDPLLGSQGSAQRANDRPRRQPPDGARGAAGA